MTDTETAENRARSAAAAPPPSRPVTGDTLAGATRDRGELAAFLQVDGGSRFEEALVLANRLHWGQTRKSTPVPYIGHLLGVASLVIENGGTEDEVIAALLHDAVEDQGGRRPSPPSAGASATRWPTSSTPARTPTSTPSRPGSSASRTTSTGRRGERAPRRGRGPPTGAASRGGRLSPVSRWRPPSRTRSAPTASGR